MDDTGIGFQMRSLNPIIPVVLSSPLGAALLHTPESRRWTITLGVLVPGAAGTADTAAMKVSPILVLSSLLGAALLGLARADEPVGTAMHTHRRGFDGLGP